MRPRNVLIATCLFLCSSVSAFTQNLPNAARPEDLGFSSERLARITQYFQSEVAKGAIPGTVLVVARNDKVVYSQALGYQDREKKITMKSDAIFRLFSMTKPITAVAAMMLAEEGKIDLMAPVAQYLPEFKDAKVGVGKIDSNTKQSTLVLEDVIRPMTVQDLLRHTSGLIYDSFGTTLIYQAYHKANMYDDSQPLSEFVKKLSKLPLAHQPGTVWEYGVSYEVLGRVVEVVSDMPLDRFVEERITRPLRMNDTVFYLTATQAARAAEPLADPSTGKRPDDFGDIADLTKEKQKLFYGGDGLLATARDYARFCQMLLNGGELDGVRLLSPKTIAIMTSDQIPPNTLRMGDLSGYQDIAPFIQLGQSYGLGFAVRTDAGHSPISGSVGDYFWAGTGGTYFWVDPTEKLFAVMMVQMDFDQSGRYRRALRELVYGALIR
jgi:CubicO group peptidase (beta-lactamase class C family)